MAARRMASPDAAAQQAEAHSPVKKAGRRCKLSPSSPARKRRSFLKQASKRTRVAKIKAAQQLKAGFCTQAA